MSKHLRLLRVIYLTILISILSSLLVVLWIYLFTAPRTIVIQANPVRGEQGLPGRDGDRGPAGKDAVFSIEGIVASEMLRRCIGALNKGQTDIVDCTGISIGRSPISIGD